MSSISSAGGGYSRWRDLAVTRWREDATRDCWGTFVYLRDVATGEFWSTAYQPTLRATKGYEAIFTQARAEFRQRHAGLEIHTEISVSPEDDVELRRITITNRSSVARVIELTSYAEVVLALPAADAAHPAFSNLFVQTEFARESSAILCTRRARSPEEKPPWLLHLMVGQGGELGDDFLRNRSRPDLSDAAERWPIPPRCRAVRRCPTPSAPVLDPIISLRRTVALPPQATAVIDLVLGVTESRDDRAGAGGEIPKLPHGRPRLRSGVDPQPGDVAPAQCHGGGSSTLRPAGQRVDLCRPRPPRQPRRAAQQPARPDADFGVMAFRATSPIVLLRISDAEKIEIVRQLIRAHSYWRMKGLTVDLVILNEEVSVYRQSLQDQITSLIVLGNRSANAGQARAASSSAASNRFRTTISCCCKPWRGLSWTTKREPWRSKWNIANVLEPAVPALTPTRSGPTDVPPPLPDRELIFTNGLGGFTRDGHEYVITLQPGQMTPAPWVNVLANPHFGTVVSESGAAYTWVENSHEFRLTPWSNDPVQDPTGEALVHSR